MTVFLRYWLPAVLWASFIFVVSSLPGENIPGIFSEQDIVFHIFEYAILALLLGRAFNFGRNQFRFCDKIKRVSWVILFCLIYAITDELHQRFVPGRIGSGMDVLVDGLGIILGSAFYEFTRAARSRCSK